MKNSIRILLSLYSSLKLKTPKRSFHWYYEDLPISHSDPEFGHLKLKSKGKSLQFRPKFIKEAMAYIEYGGLYTCTLLHESPKKLEIFAMYEITLTSVIQHDEVVSISASSCKTLEEDKDSVTQSSKFSIVKQILRNLLFELFGFSKHFHLVFFSKREIDQKNGK